MTAFLPRMLLACSLCGTAIAAAAQDGSEAAASRTPANAQKFIAAAPPEAFVGETPAVRDGELRSPDVCKTFLTGRAAVLNGTKYVAAPVAIPSTESSTATQPSTAKQGTELRTMGGILGLTYRSAKVTGIPFKAPPPAPPPQPSPDAATTPVAPSPLMEMIIDWSMVQQVESGNATPGPYVLLRTPGDSKSKDKVLYYSVANTRDRVLAAAQYLQAACDQTKELGF